MSLMVRVTGMVLATMGGFLAESAGQPTETRDGPTGPNVTVVGQAEATLVDPRVALAPPDAVVMTFQGLLTDADGNPLGGPVDIEFSFLDSTGGQVSCGVCPPAPDCVFSFANVTLANGVATVSIRDIPLCIFDVEQNDTKDLRVLVTPDPQEGDVIDSQLELAVAPFAARAFSISDGSVTSAKIVNDAVTSAHIQNGQVTSADLAKSLVLDPDGQLLLHDSASVTITLSGAGARILLARGSGSIVLDGDDGLITTTGDVEAAGRVLAGNEQGDHVILSDTGKAGDIVATGDISADGMIVAGGTLVATGDLHVGGQIILGDGATTQVVHEIEVHDEDTGDNDNVTVRISGGKELARTAPPGGSIFIRDKDGNDRIQATATVGGAIDMYNSDVISQKQTISFKAEDPGVSDNALIEVVGQMQFNDSIGAESKSRIVLDGNGTAGTLSLKHTGDPGQHKVFLSADADGMNSGGVLQLWDGMPAATATLAANGQNPGGELTLENDMNNKTVVLSANDSNGIGQLSLRSFAPFNATSSSVITGDGTLELASDAADVKITLKRGGVDEALILAEGGAVGGSLTLRHEAAGLVKFSAQGQGLVEVGGVDDDAQIRIQGFGGFSGGLLGLRSGPLNPRIETILLDGDADSRRAGKIVISDGDGPGGITPTVTLHGDNGNASGLIEVNGATAGRKVSILGDNGTNGTSGQISVEGGNDTAMLTANQLSLIRNGVGAGSVMAFSDGRLTASGQITANGGINSSTGTLNTNGNLNVNGNLTVNNGTITTSTGGSVGIGGIVDKNFKLKVYGNVDVTGDITTTSGDVTTTIGDITTTTGDITTTTGDIATGDIITNMITINGTANTINSTGNLSLQTGDTTRLYLDDNTGNIGIGTTTPESALEVQSATASTGIDINNTAPNGDPRLAFKLSGIPKFTIGVDNSDGQKFKIGTTALAGDTRLTIDSFGKVGIGTTTPQSRLDVSGTATTNGLAIFGKNSTLTMHNSAGDQTLSVAGDNLDNDGSRIAMSANGQVSIVIHGDSTPSIRLINDDGQTIVSASGGGAEKSGRLELSGPDGEVNTLLVASSLFGQSRLLVDEVLMPGGFITAFGLRVVLKIDPNTLAGVLKLSTSGRTPIILDADIGGNVGKITTDVIQINGGSDLAERFDIAVDERLAPGVVVVIDPDNPGRLKLSTVAYNRRVAGIISGAGGVKPGMTMAQQGVMDGSHLVSLAGRVYCRCDATQGPIEPGDLLTTSPTPGHAMKVADYAKAQGAILGKAMTPLIEGRGLVLVLVSLQ